MAQFDFLKWVIPRTHQVLCLLTVSQGKEVGLSVEATIWHRLVTLLARRLLDGRARLLVVRIWEANRVSDLTSLAVGLPNKVGLITAHCLEL